MDLLFNFRHILRRYPLESYLGLIFTLPILLNNKKYINFIQEYPQLWVMLPIAFMVIYYLHSIHRFVYLIGGTISAAIIIGTGIMQPHWWERFVYTAYLIAIILFLSKDWLKDNAQYANQALNTITHLVWANIAAAILYAVYYAIFLSITLLLFKNSSPIVHRDLNLHVAIFIFGGLYPIFFLYFESKRDYKVSLNNFGSIIVRVILNPGLLIYTLIIYLYIVRIIFKGEMPSNIVVHLVWPYLLLGIIIQALNYLIPQTYNRSLNLFRYLVLAPIALAWFALSIRIYHYGLTSMRVVVVALMLITTLYYICNLFKNKMQYRHFAGVAIVFSTFFGFICTPAYLAYQEQNLRFEHYAKALHLINEDGKATEDFAKILQNIQPQTPEALMLSKARESLIFISNHNYRSYSTLLALEERLGAENMKLLKLPFDHSRQQERVQHFFAYTNDDISSIELHRFATFTDVSRLTPINEQKNNLAESDSNTFHPSHTEQNSTHQNEADATDIITQRFVLSNGQELVISFDYQKHLDAIFKKHQLDISTIYHDKVLQPLNNDFLFLDTPTHLIVMNTVMIHFKQGKYRLAHEPSIRFVFKKK